MTQCMGSAGSTGSPLSGLDGTQEAEVLQDGCFPKLCRITKSPLHPKSPAPPHLPIAVTHISWPHELRIGRASPPRSQPGACKRCVRAGRCSTH